MDKWPKIKWIFGEQSFFYCLTYYQNISGVPNFKYVTTEKKCEVDTVNHGEFVSLDNAYQYFEQNYIGKQWSNADACFVILIVLLPFFEVC